MSGTTIALPAAVRATATFLICLGIACAPSAAASDGATARTGRPVMGTILQVTVIADTQESARKLVEDCVKIGEHWDDVLTTWREEGELFQLNAQAGQGPLEVSADLRTALEAMQLAARSTKGAFEPGVGPVVHRLRRGEEPTEANRLAVRNGRINSALTITDTKARLAQGATLDAGGIGKGIALDAMAEHLRAANVRGAYIDFGGSSQIALGATGDGRDGWTMVVAGAAERSVLGTFKLRTGSLSTSRASSSNNPAGAIVNPDTGRAVEPPLVVTVHAAEAALAEYWSTALVVLGAGGLDLARAAGVEAVMDNGSEVLITPGFPLVRAK
jgi:thiamine biosynthesis lipoprotein